uniref:Uncharacterized protein n=1 Tax=Glossina palpalis gambiensis TaxID=67801 RepID=A0A1B0BPY7_9MUSC
MQEGDHPFGCLCWVYLFQVGLIVGTVKITLGYRNDTRKEMLIRAFVLHLDPFKSSIQRRRPSHSANKYNAKVMNKGICDCVVVVVVVCLLYSILVDELCDSGGGWFDHNSRFVVRQPALGSSDVSCVFNVVLARSSIEALSREF